MLENRKSALLNKHGDKLRFAIVGGANTALDFGILFALTWMGLPKIPANFASTGIAFIFSFFANRSYTFQASGGDLKRQIALFIIVTLIGIWVLQPFVIFGIEQLPITEGIEENTLLLGEKLIATVVSLVWNYLLYAKVVFKK